jgi:hypothetical protein
MLMYILHIFHVFDVQESRSKVPALKINLNSKQPPQPHAFFEVSHSVKKTERSHFIVFIFLLVEKCVFFYSPSFEITVCIQK